MDKYQEKAYDMALDGHNLVILGQAGSGKSHLLNKIHDALLAIGRSVALTAMTGIAATHLVHANTIHHWAGLEDGRYPSYEHINLLEVDERFVEAKIRIKTTDTLVIDEVSMMSEKMLTKLEVACRRLRSSIHYFGGLQVILCGDVFQLPPIPKELYGDPGKYFFQCTFFNQVFPHTITLNIIHRQDDPTFVDVINEAEKGGCFLSEKSITFLNTLNRPFPEEEHAVHLFATNLDADIYNNFQLNKIPGNIFAFTSTDSGDKYYLNNILAPKTLAVKIGCKVMLLVNISSDLVNGLVGFISEIKENSLLVRFRQNSHSVQISSHIFKKYDPIAKKVLAQRKQIPLKLAYGITIHESQGMTLDSAVVNCKGVNKPGQLGVAIGRVTNSSSLKLVDFKKSCIREHNRVVYQFYSSTKENFDKCRCQSKIPIENEEEHSEQDLTQISKPCKLTADDDEDDDNFSDNEENVLDLIDKYTEYEDASTSEQAFLSLSKVTNEYKDTPYEQQANELQNMLTQHMYMFKEWYNKHFVEISKLLVSNVPNPGKVEPKNFRSFYTSMNSLLSSEQFKNTVHTLMVNLKILTNDFNFQVFVSLIFDIQQIVLKNMSENVTCDNLMPIKDIKDETISGSGRGKIRYVGGFTIAKIMHSESNAIRSCLFRSDCQQELKEHIVNMKLLEKMSANAIQLENTNDPESLLETDAKQNINRSLTNVTDEAFSFFQKLEHKCRNFLSHDNLAKYKGDIFFHLLDYICKNKEISQFFTKLFKVELHDFDQFDNPSSGNTASKIVNLLVLNAHCTVIIKNKICELFCRVCISQFRKDYLQFLKTKKTKALRQKIMEKPTILVKKLDFTSIVNDNSEGKVVSHCLLRAEIAKNSQFLQGKLFDKINLIHLGELYGIHVSKYLSKNEIASKIADVILKSDKMCCQTEPRSTSYDPVPSTSQSNAEPLSNEPSSSKYKGEKGKRGSKRKYNPNEYCTMCEKRYKNGQDCICCDHCESWLDRSCAGLDDESLWNFYCDDDNKYVCPLCKQA